MILFLRCEILKLFNQIIQSSHFLGFIKDTDLKERPHHLIKVNDLHSRLGFKIDSRNLVDSLLHYLNDAQDKIFLAPTLKKKIFKIYQNHLIQIFLLNFQQEYLFFQSSLFL